MIPIPIQIPILGAVILAASASAAAGPTCVSVQGDMARCGAAGAMPVGWTPPPEVYAARRTGEAGESDLRRLFGLGAFLAGLFGLIALMPDFEDGWDRQGEDDERRG